MTELKHSSNGKYSIPVDEGFFQIISPENSACKITWIFRLNLKKNSKYELCKKKLELNGAIIVGSVCIENGDNNHELAKFDSFYLPAGDSIKVVAREDCSIFIGGSIYENKGIFFTRKYDLKLPLADIHQVHGEESYRREVFMTVAEQDQASRLISGITIGEQGQWTSWPPHQHTKDIEEVYCFFDIPKPETAFHFSSREPKIFEFVHAVSSGDCVIIPEG